MIMKTKKMLLAVDLDTEKFRQQEKVWRKYGVELTQVKSMQEAIIYLQKREYMIVGINADCIDFWPKLKLMRSATRAAIYIMTSTFTLEEAIFAYQTGADLYTIWWDNIDKSTELGMSVAKHYEERFEQKQPINVLELSGLILYPDFREVYLNGIKINLREKEFQILKLLISYKGKIVTYDVITDEVWGMGYDDLPSSAIHNHIGKIKKEIYRISKCNQYIQNVRTVGYCFVIDKKKEK